MVDIILLYSQPGFPSFCLEISLLPSIIEVMFSLFMPIMLFARATNLMVYPPLAVVEVVLIALMPVRMSMLKIIMAPRH